MPTKYRFFSFLFILLTLVIVPATIFAVPLLQPAPPRQGIVNVAGANLRLGPGIDHPVGGSAFARDRLQIVACNFDCSWYQLEGGLWISSALVDADSLVETQIGTPTPARPPERTLSTSLQAYADVYEGVARANIRTIDNQLAVVPSPIYANGIYARDAFFTVVGLGDPQLSEQTYRWFERAQNPQSGQITTAISLDPANTSLQPQDDETTLLFLIWSGLMLREGKQIDSKVVNEAWRFVQSHSKEGRYLSAPGVFRYWADCWQLEQTDTISYAQGLYAVATRFLSDAKLTGVTPAMAAQAANGYRTLFRSDLGFIPLSANLPGSEMQDVSALLPEFLHRHFFGSGLLDDVAVLSTVNHHLETAVVYGQDNSLAGIKVIANADGSFADSAHFACPTLNRQGDYHNGGYWPMYTLVDLAMVYQIDPQPTYRGVIESLISKELVDGTAKEYWPLAPGQIGAIQPGRSDYSWNVLIVPALRDAGLIQ